MSQTATPPVKLSAGRLFGEAYGLWFENFGQWLKACVIPAVIVLLINYGVWELLVASQAEGGKAAQSGSSLRDLATSLAQAIAFTLFAVSWHRLAVLDEPVRLMPAVGSQHVRFLIWSFFLGILVAIPAAVLVGIAAGLADTAGGFAFVIGALGFLGTLYLGARLSVLLPSIAVGRSLGLGGTWRLTRGNAWALFFGHLLAVIPLLIAGVVLSLVVFGGLVPSVEEGQSLSEKEAYAVLLSAYWASALLGIVMTFVVSAVNLGVASKAYRALTS